MRDIIKLSGKLSIALLSVVTSLLLAQEPESKVHPEEGCCGKCPEMAGPPMGLLNLTEEQEKQIQALRIKHLKEVLPIETEIKIKEIELEDLWQAEKIDAKGIVAKVKEIGELRNKLELAKVNHRIEVYKLLTPEQRKVFRWHRFGSGEGMRERLRRRMRVMQQQKGK